MPNNDSVIKKATTKSKTQTQSRGPEAGKPGKRGSQTQKKTYTKKGGGRKASFRKMTPGSSNVHFGRAMTLNGGRNSKGRPPERRKKEIWSGKGERESAKIWAVRRREGPAVGSPAEGGPATFVLRPCGDCDTWSSCIAIRQTPLL